MCNHYLLTIFTEHFNLGLVSDVDKTIIVPKTKRRTRPACAWQEPYEHNDMHNTKLYDYVIHNPATNMSTSLRRNKQEFKNPTENKLFSYSFNINKDLDELNRHLIIPSHLPKPQKTLIIKFVQEYWDVFRIGGVSIPIVGYEMVIDTGTNSPVAVPQPRYGMHESPIMELAIADLLKKVISRLTQHHPGRPELHWRQNLIK